jgi:hypothetical protein
MAKAQTVVWAESSLTVDVERHLKKTDGSPAADGGGHAELLTDSLQR